jgi:hypothetical protein
LKIFNISTNNPISRVEVAKVLGAVVVRVFFRVWDKWCVIGLFCGKQKKGEKKKAQG